MGAGMTEHVVQQGDHIGLIAHRHGYFDWRLIWDDAANAELRELRDNPHVLHPGDVLAIPDKAEKSLSAAATTVHTFQVTTRTLTVRMALTDYFDDAFADAPCTFDIDGSPVELTSDADGFIERDVEPTAAEGSLLVRAVTFDVRIGNLDPAEEKSGQIARLNNLGYRAGAIDPREDERFKSALEEFQCDQNLRESSGNVSGIADARTIARLKKVHGS